MFYQAKHLLVLIAIQFGENVVSILRMKTENELIVFELTNKAGYTHGEILPLSDFFSFGIVAILPKKIKVKEKVFDEI